MPKTQAPGTSTLPVIAGSSDTARTVWMQFGVCSRAQPSIMAGGVCANMRAAARTWSAATQVMGSAHSGVYGST